MRKSNREIKEKDQMVEVIKKCDVCRLALNDKDFPYIIPMNFGVEYENGEITLYFHCANEGRKLDLIRQDNKASFEMDTAHELIVAELACDYSMNYESVIGNGIVEILSDEEKVHALSILMQNYAQGQSFTFGEHHLKAVTVFKLTVSAITGKQLKK